MYITNVNRGNTTIILMMASLESSPLPFPLFSSLAPLTLLTILTVAITDPKSATFNGPRLLPSRLALSQASMSVPYIGAKISLTSRSLIRYEGILAGVNPRDATISLERGTFSRI